MTVGGATDSDLTPPFVVADGGDITMFDSIERLSGYLEHYDVNDDVYSAWDATGRTVWLSVGPKDEVQATSGELSDQSRANLRSVLVEFVAAVQASRPDLGLPSTAGLSLGDLVATVRTLSR